MPKINLTTLKNKLSIILAIVTIVSILFTIYQTIRKDYFKDKSIENYENMLRWKSNYESANISYVTDTLKNGRIIHKLTQTVIKQNELIYYKGKEIENLRRVLKDNEIEKKELNQYIKLQAEENKTLQGDLEIVYSNDSLEKGYSFLTDSTTTIEITITKDSAFASYKSLIDVDIFFTDEQVLYKPLEDRTKFGRWWVNTKLGYKLAKKSYSPKVKVNFNNKNIIPKNIKVIKVESNDNR